LLNLFDITVASGNDVEIK
jgi:hypothetical protein